ncbi:transporter [Croceicoccus naphthovorans]|uniref:Uncharacterized protein n=1 Tax=Croceicoccus naphthovorans TaxID=1348774 RepID=A0A0G3XIQ9_9SPHN|nr:transporter [Croceicoccus naphthovorans]AKM10504.1 hypothetical protein AB433_11900 [Croceicoccus naphthovorans]MBB3988693.1 hypothetical protein [Croceicoccus naphthovorans]
MKEYITGGACALLATLPAPAALAETATLAETSTVADAGEGDPIVVETALMHPTAGLMHDHMHDGGEAMIGLRFERRRYSGANVAGTDTLTDAEVLAAGYGARARTMEMDMIMLDLMVAPSDKVTLMVMPHYMWHRMEMVGIDPMAGMPMEGEMDHHHGMALGYGEVHEHAAEGFGDTLVSASYTLAKTHAFRAHATLGLWVPTGSVEKKNADGTYVHYGMQPGSGTWDLEPSLTVSGTTGAVGWGGQAAYRWRTAEFNDAGFSFGDRFQASGWTSYRLSASLGAVARVEYVHEGQVLGHYDGPHAHTSPANFQQNYGGDTVSVGLGANWLLPVGERAPQLSAEFALPVHQDLNGVQLPQDWRLSVGLSQTF